ncbi:MAG: hypothetical protein QXI12_07415 [Candidatus Methanomethyliaceae archaeon]
MKIIEKVFFSRLYMNASYLILNSATTAIVGFVFWALVAWRFALFDVGIGSALIAASGLVSSLANLGFGNGLVRFVPEVRERTGDLINSAFTLTFATAAAGALIYIIGAVVWSPKLDFMRVEYLLATGFILTTGFSTVSGLLDSAFVAQRACRYIFWKNALVSVLKLPLPLFVFLRLGGFGIFVSAGLSTAVGVTVALYVFMKRAYLDYRVKPGISRDLVRIVLPFSISNYLATLFNNATGFIFPLMVLSLRGAEESAYFYMAWMIASVISIVPTGVGTSLFAECSHCPENLNHHVKRALVLSLALLVPAVGVVFALAPLLLHFFGHGYASNGTAVLRWVLLANFPLAVASFYNTVNQVRKRLVYIIVQAFATSSLTIGLGYWLLAHVGLAGIGIAYTLANLVVALVVAVPLWRAVREVPVTPEFDRVPVGIAEAVGVKES